MSESREYSNPFDAENEENLFIYNKNASKPLATQRTLLPIYLFSMYRFVLYIKFDLTLTDKRTPHFVFS